MMTNIDEVNILTIQSHVVHGFVGNKIATFVLQVSGLATDIINSVQFSNHTSYNHVTGKELSSTKLKDLFCGLELNNFDKKYSHILTGYNRSLSFSEEVYLFIKKLKNNKKQFFYLCDPVLGDNNKLYVPENLVDFYKNHLLSISDAITPNQFEAETLCGFNFENEKDVIKCFDILHSKGPKIVIISGVKFSNDSKNLTNYASIRGGDQFKIVIPKFDVYFVGTGDLFSSLFLVWLIKTNYNIKESLEKVVSIVEDILLDTKKYVEDKKCKLNDISNLELRIVQGKKYIEQPITKYYCEKINN